jgi:hypothetical protein
MGARTILFLAVLHDLAKKYGSKMEVISLYNLYLTHTTKLDNFGKMGLFPQGG